MIEYLYLVVGLLGGFALGLITLIYYARQISKFSLEVMLEYYSKDNFTLAELKRMLGVNENDQKETDL